MNNFGSGRHEKYVKVKNLGSEKSESFKGKSWVEAQLVVYGPRTNSPAGPTCQFSTFTFFNILPPLVVSFSRNPIF